MTTETRIKFGKAALQSVELPESGKRLTIYDAETPKLNGQWAEYLEMELMKYRTESVKMPHKKMRGNAKKLEEADVSAAAQFYAAQPK